MPRWGRMVAPKRNWRPRGHGRTSTTMAPENLFVQSARIAVYKWRRTTTHVLADWVLACCVGLKSCWCHCKRAAGMMLHFLSTTFSRRTWNIHYNPHGPSHYFGILSSVFFQSLDIPNEVILQILKLLEKSDLNPTRLVSSGQF